MWHACCRMLRWERRHILRRWLPSTLATRRAHQLASETDCWSCGSVTATSASIIIKVFARRSFSLSVTRIKRYGESDVLLPTCFMLFQDGAFINQSYPLMYCRCVLFFVHGYSSPMFTATCNDCWSQGVPEFQAETDCEYHFLWRTRYACAARHEKGENCIVADPYFPDHRYDLRPLQKLGSQKFTYTNSSTHSKYDFLLSVCSPLSTKKICANGNEKVRLYGVTIRE